ncbi:MAG TPA: prepilin-type N-terminal cleavage/methylation domain-containing protein, partial [Chthoniobacteraceae bacterium]|nr:prepilin-type N-terminal cleavage/methylation domain-containing protein [Chthoniobacteraceae bacterium]
MMRRPSAIAGFTITELLVAIAVFGMVAVGLVSFSSTALRLIARNLATNHSHEVMRISNQQLLRDLHDAASPFCLVNFDGATYTDVVATASSNQDPFTGDFISVRANGVRFRRLAGGPYRFTASTIPASTTLSFDFGVGSTLPYVPQVGDKLVVPLIAREFDISTINVSPTVGSTIGTVGISDPAGIGFTIDAVTAGKLTTACFYREVAYTVFDNQLRTHPNFNGANKDVFNLVRDCVTSPQPFAVLFPAGAPASECTDLRVSLESYDTRYSAQMFKSGTATFQAIVPSR